MKATDQLQGTLFHRSPRWQTELRTLRIHLGWLISIRHDGLGRRWDVVRAGQVKKRQRYTGSTTIEPNTAMASSLDEDDMCLWKGRLHPPNELLVRSVGRVFNRPRISFTKDFQNHQ